MMRWMLLTGEYPPQNGGVSDYSWQVAHALEARGDEVHVWAPPVSADPAEDRRVTVHRLPDHFCWRGLRMLDRALEAAPRNARMLIQYVPHAFGWKGMNLLFCLWLWRRRAHKYVVVFHEVAFPWPESPRAFRHWVLAMTTRLMASLVARAADQVFVSIPAWAKMLPRQAEWLPVPSNVRTEVIAADVLGLRERILRSRGGGIRLVGHFGTYGEHITPSLRRLASDLFSTLEGPDHPMICLLFMGQGSIEFEAALAREFPCGVTCIVATGRLEPVSLATHLAACDLLVQPYIDGVSSRRGSVMAGLALGLPIITTEGPLTESVWKESGAVCLVENTGQIAGQVRSLLADGPRRTRLGSAAKLLYDNSFRLEHTVSALRAYGRKSVGSLNPA